MIITWPIIDDIPKINKERISTRFINFSLIEIFGLIKIFQQYSNYVTRSFHSTGDHPQGGLVTLH